jgi:BASS family bile acid:Na+ symporter
MSTRSVTDLFPCWAILLATVAHFVPGPFAAGKDAIAPLLGVVMLGMGLTLTGESFRLVLRRAKVVVAGVAMQFLLMPLIAWLTARLLGLPPALAAGVVLVGACPGGTASNVMTFLARGDVALSVTLTTVGTVLSVVATPMLTWAYIGRSVDVPVFDMLVGILWIVLIPVAVGTFLNTRFGSRLDRVRPLFPLVSMLAIVVIIAIIVGLTAGRLPEVGASVLAAVALHNAGGLAFGYGFGRLLGFTPRERRTLAIEVGMQNSGLGVALANQYFSPLATLPGAVFSIWHNLSGSALAAWWARRPADAPAPRRERGP